MEWVKVWLSAARLKTLPLAAGGIVLGSFLAAYEFSFSWPIFLLALFTALLLQILSNLANDYGDFKKGTDQRAMRTDRALSSGRISENQMKRALWVVSCVTLVLGLTLLYVSFKSMNLLFIVWLLIGLAAIVSALKYTVGKNAFGYIGLGDLFVFLFFGPVAVAGTYFLMTNRLPFNIWIPAKAFGFLCVMVLNINNIRDLESDRLSGKRTFASWLGFKHAIWYQHVLWALAMLFFILFSRVTEAAYDQLLPIAFGIFYYVNTAKLYKNQGDKTVYNAALKQVSLANLMFVLLLGFIWMMA